MLPALAKETKGALERGGGLAGGIFGLLAAGAGSLTLAPLAVGLTGVAVAGLGVALFGFLAPEDVKRFRRITFRDASSDDLDRFHSRLSEFTQSLVPLSERHKISRKNPGCFRVIEDIRDDVWRRSLDILALCPLTGTALEAVLRGDLRGSDLRAQHIVKSFGGAAGLYISFAEGKTFTTRGLILREIQQAMTRIRVRPLPVATIPTTGDALALVTNKGFLGLDGQPPKLGEVCALRFDA